MEINYCLKKGKGKGNLYLPSFVVTLFCRRALMSSRSYVAALLCRRALMSPRSYVARSFCGALLSRYHIFQSLSHSITSLFEKVSIETFVEFTLFHSLLGGKFNQVIFTLIS
jgi:hypothetical protein